MPPSLLDAWPLAAAFCLTALGCGVRAGGTAPSRIGRSEAPTLASGAPAPQADPAPAPAVEVDRQPGLSLPSWARARRPKPDEPGATGAEDVDGQTPDLEGERATGEELGEAGGSQGGTPGDVVEDGEQGGAIAP